MENSKHKKIKPIRNFMSAVSFIGNKKNKILNFINRAGELNKVLIYDVDFTPSIIQIYIENEQKNINLKICEDFTKSLLKLCDTDGIEGVECEVSSPGLERKLNKKWHFQKAIGESIRVHTSQPVFCTPQTTKDTKDTKDTKQKTILTGILQSYKEDIISIKQDISEWTVPLNIIKKARVIFIPIKNNTKRRKV